MIILGIIIVLLGVFVMGVWFARFIDDWQEMKANNLRRFSE
jgi:hypothetical protein